MPLALSAGLKQFIRSDNSDSALIKASLARRIIRDAGALVSSGETVQSETTPPAGLETPSSASAAPVVQTAAETATL